MMVPGVTRISRTLHAGIYREAFTLVEEAVPGHAIYSRSPVV